MTDFKEFFDVLVDAPAHVVICFNLDGVQDCSIGSQISETKFKSNGKEYTSFTAERLFTQEDVDKAMNAVEEVLDTVPIQHAIKYEVEIDIMERYGTVGSEWLEADETPALIRIYNLKFIWPIDASTQSLVDAGVTVYR